MNPAIDLSLIPRSLQLLIAKQVGPAVVSLWMNAEALWVTKYDIEKNLLRDMASGGYREFNLATALGCTEGLRAGDFGKRLAAVREAWAFVSTSPEYIAARDLLEPLLVEATAQARDAGWQKPWEL